MTYAMSDLHGNVEKWERMLTQISFSDNDTLYILGDVLDRGPHPITLLQYIAKMKNVVCLMGNHEWLFLNQFAPFLLLPEEKINISKNFFQYMLFEKWNKSDGHSTSTEFAALSRKKQNEILRYLAQMPLYREATVNKQKYIFTHSGLGNFHKEKPLNEYTTTELLETRICDSTEYYSDKTVMVGHTPTFFLNEQVAGKIYHGKGLINVDCGASFSNRRGTLGCLRLDDYAEFYV